jgi:hypothetical protein
LIDSFFCFFFFVLVHLTLWLLSRVSSTDGENDGDVGELFWPFLSTAWVMSGEYMGRMESLGAYSGQSAEMWGNGSMFAIYYYKNCAVTFDVLPELAGDPALVDETEVGTYIDYLSGGQ